MKQFCILGKVLFVLFLVSVSCKSSQPQYKFVKPSERVGWQQKIKKDEVGFYNVTQQVTANIDSPPEIKGKKSFHDAVEVPRSCIKHARTTKKSVVGKIEFLVDEQGQASHFFILKSVGECDKALAKSFAKATFKPAMADGKPKPTLVHFTMIFRFVGSGSMQQQKIY